MALFRYKNSNNWWYELQFAGQRIRESTKTSSKKLAADAERVRRRQMEEGFNGVKKREKGQIVCCRCRRLARNEVADARDFKYPD